MKGFIRYFFWSSSIRSVHKVTIKEGERSKWTENDKGATPVVKSVENDQGP